MLRLPEFGIFRQQPIGRLPGVHQRFGIGAQVGNMHLGQTVLSGTEEISRSAQTQVFLCNAETVRGFAP